MKSKIFKVLLLLIAPVLSGALLVLAFPPFDLGWLAWVALVPLLIVISSRSLKFGFFSSYVCGAVFFFGFFAWILDIRGYRFYHHIILAVYLGAYFASFGLTFNLIYRRWSAAAAHLAAPFIWVSLEYVKSHLSFLALPMPLLGYSQYQNLSIIQIASITGVYGVSFLVVMANAALSLMVLLFLFRSGQLGREGFLPVSGWQVLAILLASMALTGATILNGQTVLSKPIVGKEIRISLLQGNITRSKKWNPRYKKHIMSTYADLSTEAAKDRPALIIWPEAATPSYILNNRPLLKQIRSIMREADTHFLIGSAQYSKSITKKPSREVKIGNTALFFSPNGKVLDKYLKIYLVPFGEYVPYADKIPWPDFIAVRGNRSWDLPGEEFTIFDLNGTKFGTVICWESIFPELFRKFVRDGANFMINITNEGWFGEAAPYQLLAINAFRAVENRLFLVRCANTGISCFIDPYGRILDRVRGENGRDLSVRGILNGTVIPLDSKTIYTRYGDWLAWLSIAGSVLLLVIAFVRKYSSSTD